MRKHTAEFLRPRIQMATAITLAIVIIGCALWSYATGGVLAVLLDGDLGATEKIDAVRIAFETWGPLAPVVYVLFVTIEVVIAPIPGTMLYAPGGVIFGGWLGGFCALVGNVLGAGIACGLMRTLDKNLFGHRDRGLLARYEPLLERRGVWIIFLLRVNPLTSTDLVSYAAGMSRMPIWKVMLGTAMGMAPLCFVQAHLAAELLSIFPKLIYPLLVACAAYVVVVFWVLRKATAITPEIAAEQSDA